MSLLERVRYALIAFITKWWSWEYWPMMWVYMPVMEQYLWYSIRARQPFYFSAANPGIVTGGMRGESKNDILHKIPDLYKARTLYVEPGTTVEQALLRIQQAYIDFPVFVKPDVRERGIGAARIPHEARLGEWIENIQVPYLIQEYVDFPLELGIFYFLDPESGQGVVSSVVGKGFLEVQGNGKHTLCELVCQTPRAYFQRSRLQREYEEMWEKVVPMGDTISRYHRQSLPGHYFSGLQ